MGSVTYVRNTRGTADDFVSRLWGSHGAQLQRFLLHMLGRKEIAEEVAQETFLRLHGCRPAEVRCPQALLFDVATKLAINRLKRARQEARHTGSPEEMEAVPDAAPQPDKRLVLEEAMDRLTETVEQLTPALREVFAMRYVKHLSRVEIAGRLGITVGAVEQRLTRALAQCRARLTALGVDWVGSE